MEKAGFLRRAVAFIIDIFIIGALDAIVLALSGGAMAFDANGVPIVSPVVAAIDFLIFVVYFLAFWTLYGATPGKMIQGLKVISTDAQKEQFGLGTSVVRLIGYVISWVVFLLGFLWIIWDKDKQGWHDKMAKTYVVKYWSQAQ